MQGGDGYVGGAGGKQEAHEPLEVPQFFKISDRKTPRSSMPLEQEWLDMTMTEKSYQRTYPPHKHKIIMSVNMQRSEYMLGSDFVS